MRIFEQLWEDGKISVSESSKVSSIKVRELDFGYQFLASLRITESRVEAFCLKMENLFGISSNFAISENILVGFLSERVAKAHLAKLGDEIKGYLVYTKNLGASIDTEPFVVLSGAEKNFLFKEYLKTVAEWNQITRTPEPLKILSSSADEFERRAQTAALNQCDALLIPYVEDEKLLRDFVSCCRQFNLKPSVSLKFDSLILQSLSKLGFECYVIQFSDSGEIPLAKDLLKESCIIADGVSWLQAVGNVGAVLMRKPFIELPTGNFLRELMGSALLGKLVRVYLEIDETDDETLKILNVLNYGLVFRADAKPLPKVRLLNISRIFDDFCVEYIDEHNKYGVFKYNEGFVEEPKKIFLTKTTVTKEGKRLFHFYNEGGSSCKNFDTTH